MKRKKMPRGSKVRIGTETINKNGYTMVKTSNGWAFKHWIVAEKKLGRPLHSDERVYFKNRNNRDFRPSNIEVRERKSHADGLS